MYRLHLFAFSPRLNFAPPCICIVFFLPWRIVGVSKVSNVLHRMRNTLEYGVLPVGWSRNRAGVSHGILHYLLALIDLI